MRVFGVLILVFFSALPMCAQQQQPTYTSADAENLVRTLRDGLEGHNLKRFLFAFDREQMIDYGNFADHVASLFARTDAFRVNLHVTDFQDAGKGLVVLSMDAQMDIAPRYGPTPDRRETTIQFQVVKSGDGWRVVELAPRDFFY